ncbi:hypothetical protein, partial [Parabacteroides johnsonii]
LECGCKSRTKISFMQMFGEVFYIFFSLKRRNIIWYAHARSFPPFLGHKEINDETMVTKHHFQEMKI